MMLVSYMIHTIDKLIFTTKERNRSLSKKPSMDVPGLCKYPHVLEINEIK